MNLLELISSPPGGLVYHLLTLLAAQALLGMGLDQGRRSGDGDWKRLGYAMGAFLASRLILLVAGVASVAALLPGQAVIPPLERFLDLAATLFILYAFIPRGHVSGQATRTICLLSLGVGVIVYAMFAPLWYSAIRHAPMTHYNGYWQDIVWSVWQMVLLGWGLLVARHGSMVDRRLLSGALGVLLVGRLLHVLLLSGPPHISPWPRLAMLIALPLLAAAAYRAVIEILIDRGAESERDRWTATGQAREAQTLIDALERIALTPDLPGALQRATQAVVKVLDASLCAVALVRPDNPAAVELAAVRQSNGAYETDQGSYELQSLPAIQHALSRQKQVTVNSQADDTPAWRAFFGALGARPDETLTITPLTCADETVGVLIVADTPTNWMVPHAQGNSRALIAVIGSALGHAMRAHPWGVDYQALAACLSPSGTPGDDTEPTPAGIALPQQRPVGSADETPRLLRDEPAEMADEGGEPRQDDRAGRSRR